MCYIRQHIMLPFIAFIVINYIRTIFCSNIPYTYMFRQTLYNNNIKCYLGLGHPEDLMNKSADISTPSNWYTIAMIGVYGK